MKSDLAIATLIRSRTTELGLSRGEFAKRLGYKNIAKGIRRIDALRDGDLEGTKQFLDALSQALETSAETVKRALDQTAHEIELAEKHEAEARDKIWRENFRPHAIILTERTVPSPIFVAAMIGVEKLLRIENSSVLRCWRAPNSSLNILTGIANVLVWMCPEPCGAILKLFWL
jgi:transcriptional regulator with XRE-family HTH domain